MLQRIYFFYPHKGEIEEERYSEECNFDVGNCGWKIRASRGRMKGWSLLAPIQSDTGKWLLIF